MVSQFDSHTRDLKVFDLKVCVMKVYNMKVCDLNVHDMKVCDMILGAAALFSFFHSQMTI